IASSVSCGARCRTPAGSFLTVAFRDAVWMAPPRRPSILPRSFFCAFGVPVAARSRRARAFPNPPVIRAGSVAPPHAAGGRGAEKHRAPARPDCAAQSGRVVVVTVGGVGIVVVTIVIVVGVMMVDDVDTVGAVVVVVTLVIAATSPLTITRS